MMPSTKRLLSGLAAVAVAAGIAAPTAGASTTQQFIFQDDGALHANLASALTSMRSLGATVVKVTVPWNGIAPNADSRTAPKNFTASNPASYSASAWDFFDLLDRQAAADGLKVDFMVTGPAPLWATATGVSPKATYKGAWKPNAADFGSFMKALGTRYSGKYKPKGLTYVLPRVSMWSIWNEPNDGPDLAPQATDNNTVYTGAEMYRSLLSHAWGALASSGHTTKTDTITIGETAPRGVVGAGLPGTSGGTVPVTFLQYLYCVNSKNKELTGKAATAQGCPGSASTFKRQNPALFDASGYADHPYAQGVEPGTPTYACPHLQYCWNYKTKQSSPGYLDLGEISRLTSLLKTLTGRSWPIWNTEFGYWTTPPDNTSNPIIKHEAVSPATAALYLNWAEYISYENPLIASYSQFLLVDPLDDAFSTGLELHSGAKLATYAAYETPMFMPTTTAASASSLTVWGGIRPIATVLSKASLRPKAMIQFQAGGHGSWKTLNTIKITNSRGYFDVKVRFTTSGNVRVAWDQGKTLVTSRTQKITVR